MQEAHLVLETPLGRYALSATAEGVTRFQPEAAGAPRLDGGDGPARRAAEAARDAFEAYFASECDALASLALAPTGTPFQRRVWEALRGIAPGATASYGEIAKQIGRPGAARAVGSANHHNPIAVAIPCHRVVGSDGSLVGYAGGVHRKRWLLAHEADFLLRPAPPRRGLEAPRSAVSSPAG